MASADESDDGWDEFLDQFAKQRYKNAFSEDNWEEVISNNTAFIQTLISVTSVTEFDKIPLFMKKAPEVIDPKLHPEWACIQALINDEDTTPEGNLKNEGNAHFQEKKYDKAVVAYTAGLKTNCEDQDINTILLTNRAASQYYQGNMRSALSDSCAALKVKPDHLKALIRGAQCCMELRSFAEAIRWCDRGLKMHPTDGKLQELRSAADKHKRAAERDARKAKAREKKERNEREAVLAAIKERGIKLLQPERPSGCGSDSEDQEQGGGPALDLLSQEATGAQVFLDEQGALHWPVLFLYPEHQQSDFISAFCDSSCFIDHLAVMFGEELPPWDTDRKYLPQNLQLFFEDEEKEVLYQVEPDMSLLKVLQHKRYCLSLFLFILDLIHCQSRMNIMFCKSWLSQLYCFGPRITILQTFFNSEDAKRNVKGHVPFRQPLISSNPHLDTRVCRHLKQIQKNKGQSGSLHPDSVYCNTVNHMNY
ncbi:Tetratricopeptide repeat protein 4 [Merluccius polli]|uniref:Tetratricopeptide repeat protein 4 n=1 Tax=Merluccius polli TaxID=89951 RepID=A0AA47N4I7_MERPO|nr:Tetratricopeptide repeat protein 4 [Merluccius polli]